ncbi:MAG TPA: nucleoside-diphosphate kinase [Thermomicrobiales bacterium]|nr:nucleoside-diphosphate kinase [Thermomicrobiales bacterium]
MADNERTLVILKPDAVQRGLAGEIISRYEKRGLKIAAMKFETVSRETAEKHYGEHKGKPFFAGLVDYITSAPSVLMVLEGPGAIDIVRTMNGATNPSAAAPGTIRADFGLTIGRNLVHASDGSESARNEVANFFGDAGVIEYDRAIDGWIIED